MAYHSPSCKQSKNRQRMKKNNNLNTATMHKQSFPISGHSPHRAIVEDYSDLGIDEDDKWQEKFADFKMKTFVRHRLFHLNDIKPVGLVPISPSAKSVSLPNVLNAIGHSRTVAPTEPGTRSHSWSPSFASSSSGSLRRSDVRRLASQEFNKYAEDNDEDYDVCLESQTDLCLNTLCRHCSSTPGCQTTLGRL
ncbi:hypothetical protein BJV77DRAFT_1054975 [Russula vinacea]|nr:hypothetical protein BJV77DRAFT_1054975 [Russula vinacea]